MPLSGLFLLSVHMSCAGREGLVVYNEAVAVAQKSVLAGALGLYLAKSLTEMAEQECMLCMILE